MQGNRTDMKKKCGARHVVLARRICSDPAGELDHGLTAFGRWVRHANPGAILVLLICLTTLLVGLIVQALARSPAVLTLREIGAALGTMVAGAALADNTQSITR